MGLSFGKEFCLLLFLFVLVFWEGTRFPLGLRIVLCQTMQL